MSYRTLIGKPAPAFKLTNYDGNDYEVKPGEAGIPTVIFFYPESGSYGCTKQACQFRDAVAEKVDFAADKVHIIGISPNSVEKQRTFVEKEKLPYPVLSDANKEVFSRYGIGRSMMGLVAVSRVTFVIDRKGIIRDALDATMNYGAHAGFVEKSLEELRKEESSSANPGQDATAKPAQE